MKKATIAYILFLIISWGLLIYKLWPALTETSLPGAPVPIFALFFLFVGVVLTAAVPPALYKLWKAIRGE